MTIPTAAKIDAWIDHSARLNQRPSPLAGLGSLFLDLGRFYDINPAAVLAIAQRETHCGTDHSQTADGFNFGNVTGAGNGTPPRIWIKDRYFALFATPQDGLRAIFERLRGPLYEKTDGTLGGLMAVYAPEYVNGQLDNDWSDMFRSFAAVGDFIGIPLDRGFRVRMDGGAPGMDVIARKNSDVTITRQICNQNGGSNFPNTPLHPTGGLYVTWHETANERPDATAAMHANFVCGGGGSDNVSFHLTVDKTGVRQMMPLNVNAYHAADGCDDYEGDVGCFASIAIECCVNDPMGSDGWVQTIANMHALLMAILKGDKRLDWGGTDYRRFSVDRIRPHNRWYPAKYCPTRALKLGLITYAGTGQMIDVLKKSIGATKSYAKPAVVPEWTGFDVQIGSNTWRPVRRWVVAARKTKALAYFDPDAPTTRADIAQGEKFAVDWHVTTGSGRQCWVTPYGTRVDAEDVNPKVSWQ